MAAAKPFVCPPSTALRVHKCISAAIQLRAMSSFRGDQNRGRTFFELMKTIDVPEDFLADRKDEPPQNRDSF